MDSNPPQTVDDLRSLVRRAEAGDASALPGLRKLLACPKAVAAFGGDLARQVELSFVEVLTGENLLAREALLRKLELLRAELAGPNPSAVERLLVERAIACWLQVQDADIRFAQAANLDGHRLVDYQVRMDRAHRRYLAALKTLAQVRKLAVPVLQVNIAQTQVNVAG